MRDIKIRILVDEQKNMITVAEDFTALGMQEGVDKVLFLIGLYTHLINQQAVKLKQKQQVNFKKEGK